jgi:hypothetical protein
MGHFLVVGAAAAKQLAQEVTGVLGEGLLPRP